MKIIKSKILRNVVRVFLIAIFIVVAFLLILFIGGWYSQTHTSTNAFTTKHGTVIEGSIAKFERLDIGGVTQSILIRGKNIKNPVLLYLHGGPGSGIIGQAKANADLEEHFTVVYWDQYGASKSYTPFLNLQHLTIEQFINDGHELTQYLKQKLSKDKITLLGHSWGSILSMHLAYKYPDDYDALINVGQVVNFRNNFKGAYEYAHSKAKENNNLEAIQELEAVHGFWDLENPAELLSQLSVSSKWLIQFGGYYHEKSDLSGWYDSPFNTEFTIFDGVPWLLGQSTSVSIMFPELFEKVALDIQITELQIPYYLLMGKSDYNTPWYMAEEYFNKLQTPQKELYWFYQSGHEPMEEEPEKFNNTLISLRDVIQNPKEVFVLEK